MEADWFSDPPSAPPWGSSPPVLRPRSPQQPSADSQPRTRRKALRHVGHAVAYLAIVFLGLDFAAEAYFISLNWVNPPVTAYMLEGGGEHLHDYVSLKYVSPYMIVATIAHEDAQFPTQFTGVDWDQWWSRVTAYLNHSKDPYGSPIPEQLTKNLLLWPSKNPIRKTLDAILAEQLVHAISKQRVLELYLNEAQFGPDIYGVCDATWYYFDEPPDDISLNEAYELMGVLPSPIHAHRLPGGGIDMNPATPDGRIELSLIRGRSSMCRKTSRLTAASNCSRRWGSPARRSVSRTGPATAGPCRPTSAS